MKPAPSVGSRLRPADHLGRWAMRWGVGRGRYRVEPGLYRRGSPGPDAPVLVTANYKLSFDEVRSRLSGIDAWLLVLDTRGINVWCAAGKGTFGTEQLLRRIEESGLAERVSHRRLVLPQLGATGIAGHEVRRRSGFRVIWGPVRARDLPAFLGAGLQATDAMRRVSFSLSERSQLVGVELAVALRYIVPLLLVLIVVGGGSWLERMRFALHWGAPLLIGLLAGSVVVPLLLPWIPGRAFAWKGALVGAALVGLSLGLAPELYAWLDRVQLWLLGTAVASFCALQFTGATPFTSPSGVEWEMRHYLGWQLGAVATALALAVARSLFT